MMMIDTQSEQAALKAKLIEINADLAEKEDYAVQLEKLKGVVADCLDIQELTPLILNKLIDKIEIGSLEETGEGKQQAITISWRFVGGLE